MTRTRYEPSGKDENAVRAASSALDATLVPLLGAHAVEFARRFSEPVRGAAAPHLFWSPGRVNLMGAHLDYNGGPVLPTSIDRGTFVATRARADGRLVLASTLDARHLDVDLDALPEAPAGSWADYPLGVVRRLLELCRERGRADRPHGLDVLFGGDLPIGAGLSSSASICVGTAFALDAEWGLELAPEDHLDAALWGERRFVGVQCGIMDPYAVRLTRPGHLLWLDCKDASIAHLPLDPERARIVVADTGIRRELAAGEFNRRVAECREAFRILATRMPEAECLRDVPLELVEEHAALLPGVLLARARHVTAEVARTFRAREALLAGDLAGFGACITEAHHSLRDAFEVSVPELDLLVEAAAGQPGCFGARLTGAGFGGCIVALVEAEAVDELCGRLDAAFLARFRRRPIVSRFRGAGGPRAVAV